MESEFKISNYLKIQNVLSLIPSFSHHVVLTGQPILINQSFNQLFFEFHIRPLESIRLNSQSNKKLIKLTLGDIYLSVKVTKQQNQFLYQEGLYRNHLVAELVFGNESLQIGMKQIKIGQWTSLLIVIEKNIYLNNQKKWTLQNCVPVLEIGSIQKSKIFQCKLKGIILTNKKQSNQVLQNIKKQKRIYDGPLDTIPQTQIPNVYDLPEYISPQQKQDKLYLCHDMEGGYKQDMNIFESYPQQKTSYNTYLHKNTYRCIHLPQASIFNYFSHHFVTIPPEHWRRMCKKSNTLCLGTFIIEQDKPTQEQYLTDYAIKMLAYFCRKYQFDGYLINFQHQIKKPSKVQPWLQKLVFQMHKAVPGSQIIWYDSIVPNGTIRYQNQVNQNNSLFYRTCDGIFLNYWWNPQKLKNSLNYVIKNKTIYVGSDCFGRGTFMGGKYDTYKAIKAIKEVNNGKNSLCPALFAMGYTQQTQKQNIELWKMNEKSLYRGLKFKKVELKHQAWKSANVKDWIAEGQWTVSLTGHRIRHIGIKLKKALNQNPKNNVVASFVSSVSGSFPNYQDRYKVSIELRFQDISLNVVSTDWKTASQNVEIVQLKTDIDADLITQQLLLVVTQESISAQNWEGYLGTRFKGDALYLSFFQKQNDWTSSINTNFPLGVNLPYFTNYNLGHGEYFYFQGVKIKKCYDYLSDNDLCLTFSMNPPTCVNIYHRDAYMGGTSLQILNTNSIKLIQVHTSKVKELKCRVVVKSLNDKINYELSYERENKKVKAKKGEKKSLQNNWEQLNYEIDLNQYNGQKTSLYLESDKSTNYLIGETAVYQVKEIDESKIESLRLHVSDYNPPIAPIFFDIYIQMSKQSRLLIKLDDQFACFGYADDLNSKKVVIKNVNSKLRRKENNLVVYLLDSSLNLKPILSQKIECGKLAYQQQIVLI